MAFCGASFPEEGREKESTSRFKSCSAGKDWGKRGYLIKIKIEPLDQEAFIVFIFRVKK